MKYKGYTAQIEFDDEAELFHGEVIGTRDVITFQGKTVDELKNAFHDSVDDYLEFCASVAREPEKPYSGNFVVRVGPELQRKVYDAAARAGMSVNAWVSNRLEAATHSKRPRKKSTAGD